jgi:apolipoprotein D and lipocalin family protein
MKTSLLKKLTALSFLGLHGIAIAGGSSKALPPLKTVGSVDIERFMGDWNVLGNIATPTEKGCHNALEQYALDENKNVAVTFSCSKNSFEAEREVHHFTGYIQNPSVNSEWKIKMNFLGFIPIKLPFLVIDLAPDYSYTVIGYPSRNYVWIMAREKSLPESTWNEIFARLKDQNYDLTRIERLPIR